MQSSAKYSLFGFIWQVESHNTHRMPHKVLELHTTFYARESS